MGSAFAFFAPSIFYPNCNPSGVHGQPSVCRFAPIGTGCGTLIGTIRQRPNWVPVSVVLYITSAYWFTSSTRFANPAITVVRSLTDSFADIAPGDVSLFIGGQLLGVLLALVTATYLFAGRDQERPNRS